MKNLIKVLTVLACIGCSNSPSINSSDKSQGHVMLKSELSRKVVENVTKESIKNVVKGNNQFGFELMNKLFDERSGKANVILSPFSIYSAFAMTYAGAKTATEKEMADVFHFTDKSTFFSEFNSLDQSLLKLNSQNNKLTINNSVWCQTGYHFESSFLDSLAINFGAGINLLDFNMTENARVTINTWVEEKTDRLIVNLLPENSLSNLTKMVLVNTLYLNALWEYQFNKTLTGKRSFYSQDEQINTDYMGMNEPVNMKYLKNDSLTAVEMCYKESDMVMDLIMPKSGNTLTISAAKFDSIMDAMANGNVYLSIPKLSLRPGTFSLKRMLNKMGMNNPFSNNADFSGMTGVKNLWIDDAYHQVALDVFEGGTIAAAATAVIMVDECIPEGENLLFDHPFIFAIRDRSTGAILFLGTIVDPRG